MAIGAVDAQTVEIESAELVAARVVSNHWLAPEQTLIMRTCGTNYSPRETAFGKLKSRAAASVLPGG